MRSRVARNFSGSKYLTPSVPAMLRNNIPAHFLCRKEEGAKVKQIVLLRIALAAVAVPAALGLLSLSVPAVEAVQSKPEEME
jgi:hypothetical protein